MYKAYSYLARRLRIGYGYLEYLRRRIYNPTIYYLQRARLYLYVV